MNPSPKRLTQWTIVVLALFLAVSTEPANSAAVNGPLTIQGIAVHGNAVTIWVANATEVTQRGRVAARVILATGGVDVSVPVVVGGGQVAPVECQMQAGAVGAIPLGVVLDDGVPF